MMPSPHPAIAPPTLWGGAFDGRGLEAGAPGDPRPNEWERLDGGRGAKGKGEGGVGVRVSMCCPASIRPAREGVVGLGAAPTAELLLRLGTGLATFWH
mmetsp:Transcript_17953/g.38271  ORF Transcript_17953/g.38271 Transcript_17953/m.38271 type:complete len:98 (+) Transcript_17953:261-554(+)